MMGRVLDGMADHMLAAANGRGYEPRRRRGGEQGRSSSPRCATRARKCWSIICLSVPNRRCASTWTARLEGGRGGGQLHAASSSPAIRHWERRFAEKKLPIVGDDIKSQLGATIVHRVLSNLFRQRGVSVSHTYQLNTGGNTDFMNMLDRERLMSKKESKTEAVQSSLGEPLAADDIHIGPSDYIPWLNDNKLCFLRMEGALFGDVPMNLELAPLGRGQPEQRRAW